MKRERSSMGQNQNAKIGEKEIQNGKGCSAGKESNFGKKDSDDNERKDVFFNFDDADCHFELELPKEFQLSSSTLSIDSASFQANGDLDKYEDLEIVTDINIIERKVSFDVDKNEYYFIDRSSDDELEYEADDEYREDNDLAIQEYATGLTEKIKHVCLEGNTNKETVASLTMANSENLNLVDKNPIKTNDPNMGKSEVFCESGEDNKLVASEAPGEAIKEETEDKKIVKIDSEMTIKGNEKTTQNNIKDIEKSGMASKDLFKVSEIPKEHSKSMDFTNEYLSTGQSNEADVEDSSNSTVEANLSVRAIHSFPSVVKEAFPTIKNNPFIIQDKKNTN